MTRGLLVALAFIAAAVALHYTSRPAPPRILRAPDADAITAAAARGRAVYAQYGCATCHAPDGKGGFANANAETDGKVPGVTFVAEGFTKRELRRKILDGLAAVGKKDPNGPRPPYRMPGWAGVMSDDELTDLVEYLWSLYPKAETDKWR